MKALFTLVLITAVTFVLPAEEPGTPVYPEDYPGKSFASYLAKYGEPSSKEFGTGEQPRHVIRFATNPMNGPTIIHPTRPPDFADSDKVLYCFWPSAPNGEECVWFRRVHGEWVSFWHSAQSNRIFCGTTASF